MSVLYIGRGLMFAEKNKNRNKMHLFFFKLNNDDQGPYLSSIQREETSPNRHRIFKNEAYYLVLLLAVEVNYLSPEGGERRDQDELK